MIYLLGAVSERKKIFILNFAYILLHIENLCDLGSIAFAVASYPCFCTRLDFLCFFNSNIYCTWLFVVPSVHHLIVVLNFSKYWWKFSHQTKCQVTNSRGQIILGNIFHSMSFINNIFLSSTQHFSAVALFAWDIHNEFSQDTLLPGPTWKEVFTLLYHWLGQWLHWGCKVVSMIIDPTAL